MANKIVETFYENGSNLWNVGSGTASLIKTQYGYTVLGSTVINNNAITLPNRITWVMEGIVSKAISGTVYLIHDLEVSNRNNIKYEGGIFYITLNTISIAISPSMLSGKMVGNPFVIAVQIDFINNTYNTILYTKDGIIKQQGKNVNIIKPNTSIVSGQIVAYNTTVNKNHKTRKVIMYDDFILENTVRDLYIGFINSLPKNPPIYLPQTLLQQPTELSDQGLVAAYSFPRCISNGKVINIAVDSIANGGNARQYDGTLNKVSIVSNKVILKQTGSSIIFGSTKTLPKTFTISCLLYNDGTSFGENILRLSGTYDIAINYNGLGAVLYTSNGETVQVNTGLQNELKGYKAITIIKNGFNMTVYKDGINMGTASLTTDNNIFNFDRIGARATDGGSKIGLIDIRIYNRAITDVEAKRYHNQFASKVVLKEDFSQYPVGANRFGNWQVKSGSWSIGEITDNKHQYLKLGTKILTCPTATTSIIEIPTPVAYGTWSFILGKPSSLSNIAIEFISTYKRTSYIHLEWIPGTNPIKIYSTSGGYLATSNNNYTTGELKIVITRDTSGKSTMIINDTDKLTWTNNSITTSQCFMWYNASAVGNYLANLQIKQGIEV